MSFVFLDGTVKLVSKVAIPANPNSTKSQLTSLLATPTQNKTFIGTRRIYMTKCKLFTLISERIIWQDYVNWSITLFQQLMEPLR